MSHQTASITLEVFPNYLIYNDGRIWSKSRKKWMSPFENVLKHRPNIQYYLRIALYNKDKKRCKKMVHWLVAKAHIENPENKPMVNHKDGNKHNNHYSNLEWVTNKENIHHALRNNLIKKKLSDDQVREIRTSFPTLSNRIVAEKFNVSIRLIGMIREGKRRTILS